MSIMESFGYPSAGAAKNTLFEEMRNAGVSRLEAHYSGGNDEGGVDGISKLLDAQGNALEVPERDSKRPKQNDSEWADQDGMVYVENPLWRAIDDMLSTEFGSWAGEFSAHGVLFADTKENRVWRDGETSTYTDDGNEY